VIINTDITRYEVVVVYALEFRSHKISGNEFQGTRITDSEVARLDARVHTDRITILNTYARKY